MALTMPMVGSEQLCEGDCDHADCQALRRTAACFCMYCEQPIGFGVEYSILHLQHLHGDWPVHEACYAEAYELDRQERDRQRFQSVA